MHENTNLPSEIEQLRSELASARQRIEFYTTMAKSQLELYRARDGIFREIAAERQRQIAKGYDAAHDDQHRLGQIATAAASHSFMAAGQFTVARDYYPWTDDTLNGDHTPRQHLVMAAALIVAEIERLDRAAQQKAA